MYSVLFLLLDQLYSNFRSIFLIYKSGYSALFPNMYINLMDCIEQGQQSKKELSTRKLCLVNTRAELLRNCI